jgi:hypothetical protein
MGRRMLKGILHAHSTYSDGEFTLPELRAVLQSSGYRFVCMSDHAEYFNRQQLDHYVSECSSLSDRRFVVVPGLEYTCWGGMHVLGYGCTSLATGDDPKEAIELITRSRGVSVIAHPKEGMFAEIRSFMALPDGVEVWNTKYDGRYAPRRSVFELLRELQLRKPELRAFYGVDLHWRTQFRNLSVVLDEEALKPSAILSSLRDGHFVALNGRLSLSANGSAGNGQLGYFRCVQLLYSLLRRSADGAGRFTAKIGIRVPVALKNQVRRLF